MLDPFIAQTMFYSFLGAYVFSIYNVSRRYVTYDMTPGVYFQTAVLMVTVIAIGYIIALYLQQDGENSLVPPALVPVFTFLIGYYDSGIRFLRSVWGRVQRRSQSQTDADNFSMGERRELPLDKVDGISIWHETRLRESGIDNIQNLAAMDIRQLLLTSRFSMPQVMNWVDQAILFTNLPENTIRNLHKVGISTMTSLVHLLGPVEPANAENLRLAPIDANDELTHDELVMLAALVKSNSESSPNLAYVTAYWRAIQQVETEQIRAQTENVLADITRLAAIPVFTNERTLDLLTNLVCTSDLKPKDLVRAFARDMASEVGLANAYIENGAYPEAIGILTETINTYSSSGEDLSSAYASRGLAYGSQATIKKNEGEEFQALYDSSEKDFKDAVKANRSYPITYIYRGALLFQRKEHQKALEDLNQAIEIDPTIPKAFLTRGKAHSVLGQHDLAISDFDRAIELARPRDLQRILEDAFYERATLYLNNAKFDKAESDFNEEIFLDSQNPLAFLGRGKALLLSGNKSNIFRAIYNFETAANLYLRQQKQRRQDRPDPNLALVYANIAQAYLQLEEYVDAAANIQRAFDLGDQSLINYKVRGLTFLKLGRLKEAIGDLSQYRSRLPDGSPEIHNLGLIIKQIESKLNPPAPMAPPAAQPPPPPAAPPPAPPTDSPAPETPAGS